MLKIATVLALALIAPSAAWAQATSQGADEIVGEVADWANSITGEKFTPAQVAAVVHVTPQGDHYAASVPLGSAPDAPKLTADIAEALGRWVIDNIRLPDHAAFKRPDGSPDFDLEIAGQSRDIILDNTFTTATLGNAALTGIGLRAYREDGKHGTTIQIGRVLQSSIVRPLFDDHADLALDTAAEAFSLIVDQPDAEPVKVGFARLRNSIALSGTSRAGTARLVQALAASGDAKHAAEAKLPPGSLARAFAGFTSAVTTGSSFDGLAWDNGELAGSVRSGQIVVQVAQQDGLIHGGLQIDADTLALAGAKAAPFADYLPQRFSLHESFANLPVAALIRLNVLNDTGVTPADKDWEELFAPGGLQIGLDEFLLEVGGVTVTATGKTVLTTVKDGSFTGTVTASGLDTLQQRLAASPELAPAIAGIIFLKGVGRTVDDRMVWDISYHAGQLIVNNQNLSAMLQSLIGQLPTPP